MNIVLIERGAALVGAALVGVTAIVQLKNDWVARGIDAGITKLLLGLMAVGCVLALLAAVNVLGARS
jgi:hypothetical protein